ncbi:MAG: D-2-hydroxyacid dehydrogenase [Chromatiaceae bacterium]|nr:D-2-hydroxyacid dehydrogenase [Chromatiaceae bacterium]MCP5422348.1 D-2-hydroxyacid dehydrogenase [Chromatiaceae bacterium]
MRGVFLDLASLAEQDLDLSAFASVVDDWRSYPSTAPDQRLAHIRDAEVVVTNKVVLDDAIIRAAPDLRLICITATGYNNIAIDAARELGIVVSNVVAYATDSVVQHVFALILAHHTRLFDYTAAVKRGDWSNSPQFCLLDYPVRELRGMTLGIVGHGELGRGVARIAEAFGMRVIVSQRPGGAASPGRVPFDELLRTSDVITLHLPLLDNTHHLIDAEALARMKPEALLINTARGAIVDNAALADALRHGVIGGAGIDVLDVEPPPPDHPLLTRDIPNLIMTPHSAWAGRQARQNVVDETVANIRAYRNGAPRNRIA